MKARFILLFACGLVVASAWVRSGDNASKAPAKPKLALSIKPQHVADALRAVILSDREVYGQIAAEHRCSLDGSGGQSTVPGTNGLPAPCEVLRRGSQAAASKGVEYSYVLRSLTPVNKRNSPETDAEVKGLQFVQTRPDLVYTTEELLGGRCYFTAVYPDVALNQSCVACHNRLQSDTGKVFKVGDVIGALVVRIALEL